MTQYRQGTPDQNCETCAYSKARDNGQLECRYIHSSMLHRAVLFEMTCNFYMSVEYVKKMKEQDYGIVTRGE